MKLVTLLAVCLGLASLKTDAKAATDSLHVQDKEIAWVTNIDEAKGLAKQKGVPIFLYFSGSDWCPHCIKLDKEVLAKDTFQDALKNKVIFMHADFPKKTKLDPQTKEQNDLLKKQFSITGFPTVLVVDADLKLIGKPTRKLDPDQFAQEVLKLLPKA